MKDRLKNDLRHYLSARPAAAADFLAIISEALCDYEAAQKVARDRLADKAVQDLMCLAEAPRSMPKAERIGWCVSAAFHQFPEGAMIHSNGELAWWARFLDTVAAGDRGKLADYIDRMHPDKAEWWRCVVLPAVDERKASEGGR